MLGEVVIEGYVSGRPWTHSGDQFSRRGLGSYRDRQRPEKEALPPRYEVAEILNLQAVRDEARRKR
ncbi:MAG TPA: hypothetical protein VJL59_14700 [Anaerolineales bacterium]|nr:hypothetical protein [Anaerolineales bacterium]